MPADERVKYLDSLPHEEYADLMADSMVQGLNAKVLQDHFD